jgi:hypothetical protein
MTTDNIRIAWNKVSGRLCAVHPDGKEAPVAEVSWPEAYGEATEAQRRAADAPAGPGTRLVLGPTLAEIRAAFETPGG